MVIENDQKSTDFLEAAILDPARRVASISDDEIIRYFQRLVELIKHSDPTAKPLFTHIEDHFASLVPS